MRHKIERTQILVKSPAQKELAYEVIKDLPVDNEKPVEILIREQPKQRTLDQNSYYRWRIAQIASDGWYEKKQYDSDTWHIYAGRYLMPEKVTLKDGTVRSKWVDLPGGGTTIISTTQLEKACFAKFITAVEAFGASLGVHFQANRNDYGGLK